MKVVCSQCKNVFESLIIDPNMAIRDLEVKTLKHIEKVHPDFLGVLKASMSKCVQAMSMVYHFTNAMEVPEAEEGDSHQEFLNGAISNNQEIVMMAIGFDPQDDEDDLEDDTEEEEDEVIEVEPEPSDAAQNDMAPSLNS